MTKVVFFLFTLVLLLPKPAFAQELIKNFDINLVARKDGSMSIEEKIDYDFGQDFRHGIYRKIPLVSKVGDLFRVISIETRRIERDGKDEEYKLDSSAKEFEVRIGDPDKTINGIHNYFIDYLVQNGIGSNYKDHDEIYWNAIGTDWDVPIDNATFVIRTDFGIIPGETVCFTGNLGSKESNCQVSEIEGGKKVTLTKGLGPNEGLTVVSSFPVNTFPKSTLQKSEPFLEPDFKAFLKFLIPIYLILNLGLAPYLIYWYQKNKNLKRFGKPSVNFDLPEHANVRVTPSEAGTIDNTKLDKDDITATIFDLAIRKYLKIEQVKIKKRLLPDQTDHKLIKLKDFSDLNEFEKLLVYRIFGSEKVVLIKDIKLKYEDFENLEKENFKYLITKNFYTKNPKDQKAFMLFLGIVATVILNLLLGPVLIWLSRKLNGRTAIGDELDFKIDGLKIFLKNMKRYYKWQADSGYFVEKYIPFAMSLGFIDEYMAQLKILNPKYSPSFYSGSGSFYNNYALFGSSFSSNITTSAPSSSSGFSGGSSGGGGGGGGGGSW